MVAAATVTCSSQQLSSLFHSAATPIYCYRMDAIIRLAANSRPNNWTYRQLPQQNCQARHDIEPQRMLHPC